MNDITFTEEEISALCHAAGVLQGHGYEPIGSLVWSVKCKLRALQAETPETRAFHLDQFKEYAHVPV